MAKPNPSIGTCPCPVSGCDQRAAVKKFASRAKTEQGRRKGGYLYGDCPAHGRFGFDCAPAMQDYILEHIEWHENEREKRAGEHSPAHDEDPEKPTEQQKPTAPKTVPTPSTQAPAPTAAQASTQRPNLWDW